MAGASNIQRPLTGLGLPLTKVGGGRLRTKDRYDVCWGDLILAVFCPIGGRPMLRNFGSLIPNTVFELQSPLLPQRIQQYVSDAAARWCPHIRILGVTTQFQGASGPKSISISISFTPADEPTAQTRTVRLDRSDVLRALGARTA